jgi:hypothetical protein
MARKVLSPLQRQVARVHRRLLVQLFLNSLVWCWAGAILLSAGWFLIQPLLIAQPPTWLRWAVAGGLMSAATILTIVLVILRAPSQLVAALSMDAQFGLKERVTTSLTLAPEQQSSPAAQALLADVNQRVSDLDVGSGFPVRMSWAAALVPVCAMLLAIVAVFYEPPKSQATAGNSNDLSKPPVNAPAIDQKMKELVKKPREKLEPINATKSEDLERLEAELEKIANRPRSTKEEVKERIKEMTALENEMKNHEKNLADKMHSLQKHLQQLDRMGQKGDEDGPAKELEKALAEGKLDRAREEIERLGKRIAKNELTENEKKQLERQLNKLQDKLEKLAKQSDKEQQLKQANLDPATLERELKELKKESQKLGNLQDLAKQLGQCQKCLKEGNMEGAMEGLSKAGEKMKSMEGQEQELDDLKNELKQLQDAKDACCEGMGGKDGVNPSDNFSGPNDGGIGAGQRELGKKAPFNSFDAKSKSDFDPKGKKIFDGYAPGQSFKKKNGAEIAGDIKSASQEAPEAIEQQRIPKAARDMAKGYFQKMREQAEKDEKAPPKP